MGRRILDRLALYLTMTAMAFIVVMVFAFTAFSKPRGPSKAKFYDFSDQLIIGELRRPTSLNTDARTRGKFEQLLTLNKTFSPRIIDNAKERLFK